MTADALSWFPDGDPLPCPECKAAVPRDEWLDCRPGCSDCGDHAGIECPECGEQFDHVWGADRFPDPIPAPDASVEP